MYIYILYIYNIYHKDGLNQHQNSHKLCNQTGYPILNLKGSQWKLRKQRDQNFSTMGKSL